MPDSDRFQIVGQILDEFIEQLRLGHQPDIESYVAREPELANQIRDALSAVLMVEPGRAPDTVAEQRSAASLADLPEQIGEFRILRQIGRGGMGRVFEAVQDSLDRRVALKVMSWNQMAGVEQSTRFLQEAQVAARLHHTNIVPVFQVGNVDELFYYAMQLIDGAGLDAVIEELRTKGEYFANSDRITAVKNVTTNQKPRYSATTTLNTKDASTSQAKTDPPENQSGKFDGTDSASTGPGVVSIKNEHAGYFVEIARIIRQAAEALQFAHANGVLHRDIKPANLLLDYCGNAWVTDFGLAKFEDSDLTRTGQIVGTLRYMAPERLEGQDDHRCDIYSLGLTLYELATLQPALADTDQAALVGRLTKDSVGDPRKVRADVPHDLSVIIRKATAREPALRYQSAQELASDLECFEEGRPIAAQKPSVFKKLELWCKRNPGIAVLTASVFLLMFILTITSYLSSENIRKKNLKIAKQFENEKKLRIESDKNLYEASLSEFQSLANSHEPGRLKRRLNSIRTAMRIARSSDDLQFEPIEFRNMAIEALTMLDIEETKGVSLKSLELTLDNYWDFSSDLSEICVINKKGDVEIVDVADQSKKQVFKDRWFYGRTLFSPSNRFISVYGISLDQLAQCRVYDRQTGRCIVDRASTTTFGIRCATGFDAASKRFAYRADDNTVRVVDLESAKTIFKTPKVIDVEWVALSPDGKQLIFDQAKEIVLYSIDEKQRLKTFSCPESSTIGCWSPLPGWFATASQAGNIMLWNVENSTPVQTLRGHHSRLDALSFHPAGLILMSSSDDGTTRIWSPNGLELVTHRGGAQFSFDGTRMAYFDADQGYGIWKLSGVPIREFSISSVPNQAGPFSIGTAKKEPVISWASFSKTVPIANLATNKIHLETTNETVKDSVAFTEHHGEQYLRIGTPKGCLGAKYDATRQRLADIKNLATFDAWGQRVFDCGNGSFLSIQNQKSFHFVSADGKSNRVETDWWCGGADYDPVNQIVAVSSKSLPAIMLFHREKLKSAKRPQTLFHASTNKKQAAIPRFGPRGLLAISGFDSVHVVKVDKLLNWETEAKFSLNNSKAFTRAAFSSDGKVLAVTTFRSLHLYETENWKCIAKFPVPSNVKIAGEVLEMSTDVRFVGDDQWLVAGTTVGSVLVWDFKKIRNELKKMELDWE